MWITRRSGRVKADRDRRNKCCRTVPLVRDDGTTTAFTIPEFVSEPRDLEEIAHIVIAACERWENRQGVGG